MAESAYDDENVQTFEYDEVKAQIEAVSVCAFCAMGLSSVAVSVRCLYFTELFFSVRWLSSQPCSFLSIYYHSPVLTYCSGLCLQSVENVLGQNVYNPKKVHAWTQSIVEAVLKSLQQSSKPFKYVGQLFGISSCCSRLCRCNVCCFDD